MKRNKLKVAAAALAIMLGSAALGAVTITLVQNWTDTDAAISSINSNSTVFTDISSSLGTLNDNDIHLKSLIESIQNVENPIDNAAVTALIADYVANNSAVGVRVQSILNAWLDLGHLAGDADLDLLDTVLRAHITGEIALAIQNIPEVESLTPAEVSFEIQSYVDGRVNDGLPQDQLATISDLEALGVLDAEAISVLIDEADILGGRITGNWDTEADRLGGAINELHGDAAQNAENIEALVEALNLANGKVEALSDALNTTFAAEGIDFTVATTR